MLMQIMKPCKIKKENKGHEAKFAQICTSPHWRWEEKLDGISILAHDGRLDTTLLNDKSQHLPKVTALLKAFPLLVVDGEAYVPGQKSYQTNSIIGSSVEVALQKQRERGDVPYYLYDCLRTVDGVEIHSWPFDKRRAYLEDFYASHMQNQTLIRLNPVHDCSKEDPRDFFEDLVAQGLEGQVLKDGRMPYIMGKRPMWNQVKNKASFTDDVVIMGCADASIKYTGDDPHWPFWLNGVPVTEHHFKGLIGSIIVGKYDESGTLVEVGRVSGITDDLRLELTNNPDKHVGEVIVIQAFERTLDGKYRHANFEGFHPDKSPKECLLGVES